MALVGSSFHAGAAEETQLITLANTAEETQLIPLANTVANILALSRWRYVTNTFFFFYTSRQQSKPWIWTLWQLSYKACSLFSRFIVLESGGPVLREAYMALSLSCPAHICTCMHRVAHRELRNHRGIAQRCQLFLKLVHLAFRLVLGGIDRRGL